MKSFFLTISLLLILALSAVHAYEYKSDCSCTTWNGNYPDSSVNLTPSKNLTFSSDIEMINSKAYGKLMSFAKNVWLSLDVKASRSSSMITADCPKGYRIPTGAELRAILDHAKQENPGNPTAFLLNSTQANMNGSAYYVSSEKTYTNTTSGSDNIAWEYLMLYFKAGNTTVESINSYFNNDKLMAKCVLDTKGDSSIVISGLTSREHFLNVEYSLSIKKNNTLATQWDVNDVKMSTTKFLKWKPTRAGCHVVNIYVALFGGIPLRQCLILWADHYTGSEGETTLNASDIKSRNYTDYKVNFVNSMHFSSSSAPIAPKKDGGAFILFSKKEDLALYFRTINNKGDDVSPPTPLFKDGYPLDITATPWGFVSLIVDKTDTNKLYLMGSYADGKKKFEVTIMNNGADPTAAIDQIKFYTDKGDLEFGFNAMYKPHNGRLMFLRDRIYCIFAHYNHFGL